jgi:hypothetical protein
MNRTCTLVAAFALAVVALSAGIAAAGDVNVNIGWPPPLIIETPRVVMVPETRVYAAPNLEFNVFMFGGKYYSLHNDRWFMTARVGAPWTPVVIERIPVEVRAVPVKYYKVKPGHAKKMKHKDKDDDDDYDSPGHGKGHDKGCPPGLAKQGRC